MENCHVEIYDPISNHKDLNGRKDCEPKSTSDTESMEDTAEYRLLMAYAKRRRPKKEEEGVQLVAEGGLPASDSPQTPEKNTETVQDERKKKKKKKGWKRKLSNLSCISLRTKDAQLSPTAEKPDVNFRCVSREDQNKGEERLEEAVSRLREIVDDVPFRLPDLQTDSADEDHNKDVEKVIGLLLREAGDKMNAEQDEELKKAISNIFWNYSFYESLMSRLLTTMGLLPSSRDAPGPQTSPKTQIAVTCEVTSRLSAADTLPVNRLLGLGARYLQEHHSTWAQQQGGYVEAFYSEDEDDDEKE